MEQDAFNSGKYKGKHHVFCGHLTDRNNVIKYCCV